MYRLTLIFSLLISFSIAQQSNSDQYLSSTDEYIDLDTAKREVEEKLFKNVKNIQFDNIKISDVEVIEIEEEIDLGFDPKMYLPKNFNPYKGMKCRSNQPS